MTIYAVVLNISVAVRSLRFGNVGLFVVVTGRLVLCDCFNVNLLLKFAFQSLPVT